MKIIPILLVATFVVAFAYSFSAPESSREAMPDILVQSQSDVENYIKYCYERKGVPRFRPDGYEFIGKCHYE